MPAVLALVLTLAACSSTEERVEEYYQSALELIEEGDFDRAMVELRNVFKLDPGHREARIAMGTILLDEKNNLAGAYRQFLRVAEQYADDLDVRIILSELAFRNNNWEEMERHGEKAVALSPDTPRVQAIDIVLRYRAAAAADDAPALRTHKRAAEALLSELPDSLMLRNIIIDAQLRDGESAAALEGIEWLLERYPENVLYWRQRLGILAQLDDMEAIEAQLVDMVARFPDDVQIRQSLVQFYLSRGEPEKVEAFLRDQVANAAQDDTQPRADLIVFLLQTDGVDGARVELEKAIAEVSDSTRFRRLRAQVEFADGNQDIAIAELEDILETAEASSETNDIKISLARMLATSGNEVGARVRVEEVLAADPSHPEALKIQAAWQIETDNVDEAIANLRNALGRVPDDAQAMTLMSQAYMRTGNLDLSKEFLALAVEASGNAPAETIRYARVLIQDERFLPAEDLLLAAIRLAPQSMELLGVLGDLYLRMDDLGRAEQVVENFRRLGGEQGERAAKQLQVRIIARRNGVEEAVRYLENVGQSEDASIRSQIDVIGALLQTGDIERALTQSRELMEENPDSLTIQSVLANVEAANGNLNTAIDLYKDITTRHPQISAGWLALARLTARRDGTAPGEAIVTEGLAVLPQDTGLLWAKASYRENAGDVDGAIEIYEDLYSRSSGSVIVANNLASLLATYRQDEASLERAWTVARRFRDTTQPEMQDTFGWILHRRGESADALEYLEAAARGLPNDPLVQFHLAEVYRTLERPDDALAQYRRVVQIAGDGDTRWQVQEARDRVAAAQP